MFYKVKQEIEILHTDEVITHLQAILHHHNQVTGILRITGYKPIREVLYHLLQIAVITILRQR